MNNIYVNTQYTSALNCADRTKCKISKVSVW